MNYSELSLTGAKDLQLKRQPEAKLIEHRHHINEHGTGPPGIRSWRRGATTAGKPA